MTESGAEHIPDPEPRYWPLWVLLSGWIEGAEARLRSVGGSWLRHSIRVFWAIVAFAGLVLLMGPVINQPLTLNDITSSAHTATERWIAREFAVDYRITRDAGGVLNAEVEERISAFFPDAVTATGIERVLATQYQDHSLNPRNFTATLDGQPITIKESRSPNFVTLTLQNATALTGDHIFVLRYTTSHLAYPVTDQRLEVPADLLEWDVFGPSWPQGIAGLDVQITLPQELDDKLIRKPRGGIAWTFVGDSTNLSPEPESHSGEVTYRMTNDQRLPPHANAWFEMSFKSGTFSMPEPELFYWVKVFGPAVPLAFLMVTLLFALAARTVAWSDARGTPWYVARYDPPRGISPATAAQILEKPGARELAVALAEAQNTGTARKPSRNNLIVAARIAKRTGRVGDIPFAVSRYLSANERARQLAEGIRRLPHGFVRDFFLWAPIALTLVQWGLVRQLSFQRTTALLWWPFAFVVLSSLVAFIIVWIAISQRPLTKKGALIKQHLRGIDAYSSQTLLLERGTSIDKALPYAVLFGNPRHVGKRIVSLIESELGEGNVSGQWLTSSFLTWSRIVVRVLSVALVAGAITFVTIGPAYAPRHDPISYQSGPIDSRDSWSDVTSFEAHATLSRTPEGLARLVVREDLTVVFSHSGTRISQFAQQWPNRVDGQELTVEVTRLAIDGKVAPHVTEPDGDTLLLRTKLTDPLEGEHSVRVEYVVESAAVAAKEKGETVDRVRWAALLRGWKFDTYWDADPGMKEMRIELTVDADLARQALSGGWMTRDANTAERAKDWKESVLPFDTKVLRENSISYQLVLTRDQNDSWPWDYTLTDLGPSLDFPPGTFVGPNATALQLKQTLDSLPFVVGMGVSLLAFLLGLYGVIAGLRRRGRVFVPGIVREAVRWLQPALTVVSFIAFVWMTFAVDADDPIVGPLGWSLLAALTVTIASLTLTTKRRAAGDRHGRMAR